MTENLAIALKEVDKEVSPPIRQLVNLSVLAELNGSEKYRELGELISRFAEHTLDYEHASDAYDNGHRYILTTVTNHYDDSLEGDYESSEEIEQEVPLDKVKEDFAKDLISGWNEMYGFLLSDYTVIQRLLISLHSSAQKLGFNGTDRQLAMELVKSSDVRKFAVDFVQRYTG